MTILLIMILWTWGLTPLWVNIVGSVLLGFKLSISIIKETVKIVKEK